MIKKSVISIILIFMTCLFSGCKNDEAVINSESEYLVIYSDMLKPDGGYYYINKKNSNHSNSSK